MKTKEDLIKRIQELKKQREAIILVHNYQIGEVQDIGDFLGDSLELSRTASQTDAKVILFCGVHFMAETASILCPEKIVLMPEVSAGCPMASMITPESLKALKRKHPNAIVVGYVNTSAAVKAEVDICCTSTNAIPVVSSIRKDQEVIFVPDKYLAAYISLRTDRKLIPWDGYCPTHIKILPEDILRQKKIHPKAEVIVHPECHLEAIALADKTLSTSGMCKYAKESTANEIIVGTEVGIIHRLKKENPDKLFYPASEMATCPNMKMNTLEKVLWSLEDMKYEIKVPEKIRVKAKRAVDRMLEVK